MAVCGTFQRTTPRTGTNLCRTVGWQAETRARSVHPLHFDVARGVCDADVVDRDDAGMVQRLENFVRSKAGARSQRHRR